MLSKQEIITYSLAEIDEAVVRFWQLAQSYPVIAFSGTLGAGKTTFIHALCNYLGVTDAVSSPTFALINEYSFQANGMEQRIYHMDWYRLRDTEEAIHAGMEDALQQPGAYCFVEWPEKAPDLLRAPYLWVNITATGTDERRMTLEAR